MDSATSKTGDSLNAEKKPSFLSLFSEFAVKVTIKRSALLSISTGNTSIWHALFQSYKRCFPTSRSLLLVERLSKELNETPTRSFAYLIIRTLKSFIVPEFDVPREGYFFPQAEAKWKRIVKSNPSRRHMLQDWKDLDGLDNVSSSLLELVVAVVDFQLGFFEVVNTTEVSGGVLGHRFNPSNPNLTILKDGEQYLAVDPPYSRLSAKHQHSDLSYYSTFEALTGDAIYRGSLQGTPIPLKDLGPPVTLPSKIIFLPRSFHSPPLNQAPQPSRDDPNPSTTSSNHVNDHEMDDPEPQITSFQARTSTSTAAGGMSSRRERIRSRGDCVDEDDGECARGSLQSTPIPGLSQR